MGIVTEPVIVLDPTARRVYFDDTFDAFAAFRDQRPGVCATIEADPLGTVNRIVRICRMDGGRRIPPEHPEPLRELPTAPGWRIDVDGLTVLRVPDSDIWPQPPAPRVPMRLRATQAAKRAARNRARQVGDAIAHRFGYIRDDEDRW